MSSAEGAGPPGGPPEPSLREARWERWIRLFRGQQARGGDGRGGRGGGGPRAAPFRSDLGGLPRDPVPVDAIPDIGENQQIVFTEWLGRSPRDVEDQVTYPLTVALLGMPGVRTMRSS